MIVYHLHINFTQNQLLHLDRSIILLTTLVSMQADTLLPEFLSDCKQTTWKVPSLVT